jgi:hypothetical protein
MLRKEGKTYSARHPDQIRITSSLIKDLIVGCSIPMHIVEKPAFRRFLENANSLYTLPARSTVTSKLIPQELEKMQDELSQQLAKCANIALTVDIWTDRRVHSFLACTGHGFVDCKPVNMLLAFKTIKGRHTGALIAEELNRILDSNQLRAKVQYVVSDNAANMKKAMQVLNDMEREDDVEEATATLDDEELWADLSEEDQAEVYQVIDRVSTERLSCYAHTAQLHVKDGLSKLSTATGILAKSSKLANLTHQSGSFREKFELAFGKGRSIPKVNATRWNSMFHQLASIVALDENKLADLVRSNGHGNLLYTARETAMLKELFEILKPDAEATDLLQGQNYTTIGCVVPAIVSLYKCLTTFTTTAKYHTPLVNALLNSLIDRFRGILENVHIIPRRIRENSLAPFSSDIYLMASALDPKYALLWLEEDHPGSEQVKKLVRDNIMS